MGGGANGSAQGVPEDETPENKLPKQEVAPPKPANPYPHILTGVPEGSVAAEIQKFFKPHRAIAVNVKTGGEVDVAFKTHDAALNAMDKDGAEFKDTTLALTLNSENV